MQYIITFLEGLISFISPCMLPMLPVYISYFVGSGDKKHHVYARVACFILGFTLVFSALGLSPVRWARFCCGTVQRSMW